VERLAFAAAAADRALDTLRAHPLGAEAAIVGEVRTEPEGFVVLRAAFGGSRIVDSSSATRCLGSAKRTGNDLLPRDRIG
jgi:hydrogenase maturation factor